MTVNDAPTMLDVALHALEHGYAVVPPKQDGSKRPDGQWKTYQQQLPTKAEVRAWYASGRTGIGIITGAVSGNLEMLEFEGRAMEENIGEQFADLAGAAGLTELVDRINAGYCETTPTGGLHLLYRVTGPVAGNTKLARRPATPDELAAKPDDPIRVLIETRGEGGYVVVAPSHGRVHPTRSEWVLLNGGFDQVATITEAERDELHRIARALDQLPTPPTSSCTTPAAPPLLNGGDGDRPGDAYNSDPGAPQATLQLLERHGWAEVFRRPHDGHQDVHLRRPGKSVGTSAVLHLDAGTLVVFSTSTVFDQEVGYTPFAVLTTLEHHGDYKVAARALRPAGGAQDDRDLAWAQIGHPTPAEQTVHAPADAAPLYQPIDWTTFWEREVIGEDWLIEPLVPRGRQVALWATHKTGKSLLSLEVAAAIATGRPVLRQPAGDPVDVVYVDLEMTVDDLYERLADMGYGPEDDLSRLHYYLLPALPPLDQASGGAAVVGLAVQHQAQLVVIDTMARAVAGEENDADTYRDFYRYTGLHLKARGIAMMRLDHGGKDATRGQRGSSSKGDDVDVVWRLRQADGGLELKRDVARMSWIPETLALERVTEPHLSHRVAAALWKSGTAEVAHDLDELGAPIDIAQRAAAALLKSAGRGRKTEIVRDAIRYRKSDLRNLKDLEIRG